MTQVHMYCGSLLIGAAMLTQLMQNWSGQPIRRVTYKLAFCLDLY